MVSGRYLLVSIGLGLLIGCSPDDPVSPEDGNLTIAFSHKVDGDSLQFHSAYYTNAAGNEYRVTRLQYFVSGIELYRNGQRQYLQDCEPYKVNAEKPEYCSFQVRGIPAGRVDSIAFCLGVVPEWNYSYSFQLLPEDIHMYWSPALGGGYHFLKFEGHWTDADQYGGFAFHIGFNEYLLHVGYPVNLEIPDGGIADLHVEMNVNEWFNNPFQFNLRDGNGYTMGDSVLMYRLMENGKHTMRIRP